MPEFAAPGLGRESNHVTIDAELGENASGVLYALGARRRLALYMDKGQLVYEYNMMIIERYIARSAGQDPAGKHRIEVATQIAKPGARRTWCSLSMVQRSLAPTVKRTVPAAFTASETLRCGSRSRLARLARLL